MKRDRGLEGELAWGLEGELDEELELELELD